MLDALAFDDEFTKLLRVDAPLAWQRRLFGCLAAGNLPAALDLPTGLGKTAVMAIWLIARAHGARLPRRLIYVVDRRAVVDQATTEAQLLDHVLPGHGDPRAGHGSQRGAANHDGHRIRRVLVHHRVSTTPFPGFSKACVFHYGTSGSYVFGRRISYSAFPR